MTRHTTTLRFLAAATATALGTPLAFAQDGALTDRVSKLETIVASLEARLTTLESGASAAAPVEAIIADRAVVDALAGIESLAENTPEGAGLVVARDHRAGMVAAAIVRSADALRLLALGGKASIDVEKGWLTIDSPPGADGAPATSTGFAIVGSASCPVTTEEGDASADAAPGCSIAGVISGPDALQRLLAESASGDADVNGRGGAVAQVCIVLLRDLVSKQFASINLGDGSDTDSIRVGQTARVNEDVDHAEIDIVDPETGEAITRTFDLGDAEEPDPPGDISESGTEDSAADEPEAAASSARFTLTPNAELRGRLGRIIIKYPAGSGAGYAGVYRAGEDKAAVGDYGGVTAELLPGAYTVVINTKRIEGVEIRSGHETRVHVGTVRITVPSRGYAGIFEPRATKALTGDYGGGAFALPPGTYEVEIAGQRATVAVRDGQVTDF